MNDRTVDVICQFKRDGSIIPMRMRLEDEDGLEQTFNIKSYYVCNDYYHGGKKNEDRRNLDSIIQFSCKVEVFRYEKVISLIYFVSSGFWKIRY